MKTNVIETQGLTRRYGRQEAVHELTLTVPTGSVFTLLGPNGAGKSTTLKMLMNLVRPTAGVARVLGKDSRELGVAEKQRIGYVADGQELPDWMTVREFLEFCRPLYPTWDRELERTLLARFELPEDRTLKALSRGMRMKAALLSVLAFRPELLLLDEPFSGLDPAVRDDFIRGLLEVSSLGQWTVLLSSHDIEEVERLADHIALIDGGRLRLSESLESLQTRLRRVEVTVPADASAGAGEWPATWWEREQSGALLRFVETAYAPGGACEARYTARFPGAEVVVRPVPLREAYLILARRKA